VSPGGARRARLIAWVAAADPLLTRAQVTDALDAAVAGPAAARSLAAALEQDPNALAGGAPPVVGRLVDALIARGSRSFTEPACVICARTGHRLTRSADGGVCARCRARQLATACARCGVVKPVAGREIDGRAVCARCADRPRRECGICARVRRIARRARDGQPDICDSCFRMPEATCTRCGRDRPCSFAAGPSPICTACAPRRTAACAHCGAQRPPAANWPEGPVCDPCYTAALRRRGACAGCRATRRLVHPPGPGASTCADCATLAASHICTDCGLEDRLYERGRCARCSLTRRAGELLRGDVPADLAPVRDAIVATRTPRTALNWLRGGTGAVILAELASGALPLSHEALDAHPQRRAADYLRHVLVANAALPARNEDLTRVDQWVAGLLVGLHGGDRRLVQAYATWRVLRRLRRRAEQATDPRTPTGHARTQIGAAARLLAWLHTRELTLATCGQADIDDWLSGPAGARDARDFLAWATEHHHCQPLSTPPPARRSGPATDEDDRWAAVARLLHDDTLELTDRVAGCLLLLYAQQLSRITAMTVEQVIRRDEALFLRFGHHDVAVPEPLAGLLLELLDTPRSHLGVGSPTHSRWLFPGHLPGRPLTAARLGERLRRLGIPAQAGRRAALLQLSTEVPAAVLAELLHLTPATTTRWTREAGGDWTRYAAQVLRDRGHQP
jgi:hypothetical protein